MVTANVTLRNTNPIALPPLPWADNALEPFISKNTIGFHYGKHHKTYVDKLNELIAGKPEADMPLEDIVRKTVGDPKKVEILHNAQQTWNHTFYWNSMRSKGGGKPAREIAEKIESSFGGYDAFKKTFAEAAVGQFGSGWAWLIAEGGKLKVVATPDGEDLEPGVTAPEQPARRVWSQRKAWHRKILRQGGRHGTVGDDAESEEVPGNDLVAVNRERRRPSHEGLVERRPPRVEREPVREQEGIVDHREAGVAAHEGRVRRVDPGEIDLSGDERGQFGGGLIHDDDDEAVERRRPAQLGREVRIGREHPAAIRLVRHETERPVAHRAAVPLGLAQPGMGDRVQQVGRQDREIGEHVGKRHGLCEPQHDGGVIRCGRA